MCWYVGGGFFGCFGFDGGDCLLKKKVVYFEKYFVVGDEFLFVRFEVMVDDIGFGGYVGGD